MFFLKSEKNVKYVFSNTESAWNRRHSHQTFRRSCCIWSLNSDWYNYLTYRVCCILENCVQAIHATLSHLCSHIMKDN